MLEITGCGLDLAPGGQGRVNILLAVASQGPGNQASTLEPLLLDAHREMKDNRHNRCLSLAWRGLYTDAALILTLCDCLLQEPKDELFWENSISRLDKAIIIAGAPGNMRLDIITACITLIQDAHLPPTITQSTNSAGVDTNPVQEDHTPSSAPFSFSSHITSLKQPPSMLSFSSNFRHAPFVLRGFANDWPAISEKRWSSKSYLHRIAGRGRVVPVEIGHDYRTLDWSQRIISWDTFLGYLSLPASNGSVHQKEVMYHAQHDIFKQFSALRDDIIIPDYVYASLPPPDYYVNYRPPANEDGHIVNAWLGPAGTVSPAHTVSLRFGLFYVGTMSLLILNEGSVLQFLR